MNSCSAACIPSFFQHIVVAWYRPVESHSRARETIIAGPYQSITTSFCMRQDRDAQGVEGEETWRGVFPHHPTKGLGSIVSSPSVVWGGAPAESGFYAYLRSERNHLEHSSQYFWAMAGPPKCHGARENFPHSWRAWHDSNFHCIHYIMVCKTGCKLQLENLENSGNFTFTQGIFVSEIMGIRVLCIIVRNSSIDWLGGTVTGVGGASHHAP